MRVPPIVRNRLTNVRWLMRGWTRLHVRLLRWSKGRLRFGFFLAGNLPVLALTTKGRKSGELRSSVVAYLREGDGFAVIASNAGADRPPAWWLNLQQDADCEVDAEGDRVRVRARVLEGEERERLWRRFNEENPDFDAYQSYTQREIPVVVLEPR
jgi:deazaflavin-dependent oxidoreductase (nitroreductase family)